MIKDFWRLLALVQDSERGSFTEDLSSISSRVFSIHGILDGVVLQKDIDSSRSLLPPNTTFVSILGGNHAQVGWYGPQSGDNAATISREGQQNMTVIATIASLDEI